MDEIDVPFLIVPLTSSQMEAWNNGECITLNPAMQDGQIVDLS